MDELDLLSPKEMIIVRKILDEKTDSEGKCKGKGKGKGKGKDKGKGKGRSRLAKTKRATFKSKYHKKGSKNYSFVAVM